MAIRFESSADTLTIVQTRRGLRIAMWLYVVFGAVGLVMMLRPPDRRVTVTCSRADGRCAIQYGHGRTNQVALATITAVRIDGHALVLDRAGTRNYSVCRAADDELTRAAAPIDRFLKDPTAPTLTATCASTGDRGIPLAGKLAGVAGMILVLVLLGRFLVETHVVVDRAAGTIAMRGSRWPLRRWKIERRLDEVAEVWIRWVYVGRGQRMPMVHVRFTDDTSTLAFAPAARLTTVDERVAELRRQCRARGAA